MQKQIEQMPHCLTKKCPAKNIFFLLFLKKSFIGPPLPLNEFRAGMNMGKKRWLLQKKIKREIKSAVLRHTRSFFMLVGDIRTSKTSSSSIY